MYSNEDSKTIGANIFRFGKKEDIEPLTVCLFVCSCIFAITPQADKICSSHATCSATSNLMPFHFPRSTTHPQKRVKPLNLGFPLVRNVMSIKGNL